MEFQPLPKLILGGFLLIVSRGLDLFSLFRGVEWLRVNNPTAFALLDNLAFKNTLLLAGFGMCAWGLYEIWRRKHERRILPDSHPKPEGPALKQEIRESQVSGKVQQVGRDYHEHHAPQFDVDKIAEEVAKRLRQSPPSSAVLEAQLKEIQQIDDFLLKKDEQQLRLTFDFIDIVKFNIRMIKRSLKPSLVPKADSDELDEFFKDGNGQVSALYGSWTEVNNRIEFKALPGKVAVLNTSKKYREALELLLALRSSSKLPGSVIAALNDFDKTIHDNLAVMHASLNQSLSTNKRNILEDDLPGSDRYGSANGLYWSKFIHLRPKAEVVNGAIREYLGIH